MKKHILSFVCLLLALLCLLPACTKGKKTTDEPSRPSASTEETVTPDSSVKENSESEASPSPSQAPSSKDESNDPLPENTKITFIKDSISVKKGGGYEVAVNIFPSSVTAKDFTWYSSDEQIATVTEGKITALKTGTVLIGAMSSDGESYDFMFIDVVNADTDVTSIAFESDSLSIAVGTTKSLPLTYEPATVPLSNITFSVADSSVLSVNAEGVITALKIGSTTVTATSVGGKSASIQITVTDIVNKVTEIKLDKTALDLEAGKTATLQVTVLPENADNKNVVFKSSDSAVVAVSSDGTINAVRTGTATITVLSHDGTVSATCTVTVTAGNDPMDAFDLDSALFDPSQGGYYGGIRKKSSGEIMFSPEIPIIRSIFEESDKTYSDYIGYIRFTVLPVAGQSEFVFHSITAEPKKAKGDWVDFYIVGGENETGFCPTAEVFYKVELILVEKATGKAAYWAELAEVQADSEIKSSKHYNPTAQGGQVIIGPSIPSYTLSYKAVGGGVIFGLTEQTVKQGTAASIVMAIPKPGYSFTGWSDGGTSAARQDYAYADAGLTAYFTSGNGAQSNIPVMNITTSSGNPVTSKTYENATITITGAEDERFNITVTTQIRGRGNSSWNGGAPQSSYDSKNSYRLKLDEKEKLLGIGDSKNKDWVLNSNKFDLSGLRNALVWELANKMGSMTYVPDYCWVQLYVNGQYRGMYMVTELIEDANDRVELDKTVTVSEDKGYLLEIDFRGNYEDTPYFYVDGYGPTPQSDLHGAKEFVVKNDCTEEDFAYIESYIKKCHSAIMSGDKDAIDHYVDLASLIDMYILEELSKDVDVGAASFFLHKKEGGKLYFTAPWDFDFGFGTYGPAVSEGGLVSEYDSGCPWFAALVEQEWFRNAVVARMTELQPAFEELLEWINDTGTGLEGAADRNALHWDMYGNRFHQYVSSQASSYLFSYAEHIEFLADWTYTRWDMLLYLLGEGY